MKENNKRVVFYSAEKDGFLESYKDRGSLWRNKYMNLGRELGEIINSQQDRILSLSQENNKLKRELWNLKKSKGRKRL